MTIKVVVRASTGGTTHTEYRSSPASLVKAMRDMECQRTKVLGLDGGAPAQEVWVEVGTRRLTPQDIMDYQFMQVFGTATPENLLSWATSKIREMAGSV